MTILILLLAVSLGMLVGDCKEFYFKEGQNNELAYILFKMMFTILFCEISALLLLFNFYSKRYEKALASPQIKEKIKIENHTHETLFLPAEKDEEEEKETPSTPEPKTKSKSRGRSIKKLK
jgi:hypothetical protein